MLLTRLSNAHYYRCGQAHYNELGRIDENPRPFTSDITQDYLQIQTDLERDVYFMAPSEINLACGTVLKVVKPLYGIPESGLHWYLTYPDRHTERLNMQGATIEPCVMMKHHDGKQFGAVILQFEDISGIGTETILSEEDDAACYLKSKPQKWLVTKLKRLTELNLQ